MVWMECFGCAAGVPALFVCPTPDAASASNSSEQVVLLINPVLRAPSPKAGFPKDPGGGNGNNLVAAAKPPQKISLSDNCTCRAVPLPIWFVSSSAIV